MNKKEFIIILIITFFVIMVWIFSEILHSKPSVPTDPKLTSLLDSIDSNFDKTILEKVKNIRQTVASPKAEAPVVQATPSPAPLPSQATVSAEERAGETKTP